MNTMKMSVVAAVTIVCGVVCAADGDALQELIDEGDASVAAVEVDEPNVVANESAEAEVAEADADAEETEALEPAPEAGEAIGWTPIELSLFSPVQFPWGTANWDVKGLYLGIFYNDAPLMWGVDLSLANRVRKEFRGVAIGGFGNYSEQDVYGLRSSLGINVSRGTLYGFDLGGAGWHRQVYGADVELACCVQDDLYGTAISLLGNYTQNESIGVTFGGVNVAKFVQGAQIAFLFNQATELNGCQIGIFNYAQECPWGFQLGLVNVITDNVIKALPFFNCYFGSTEQ